MNRSGSSVRRVYRHVFLAGLSGLLTVMVFFGVPSPQLMFRWSMATGYAGLALLGASLLIGPWNVLRRAPNPVNTDLRRDVGIWGGVLGLVHTVVGLQVHMSGKFWLYFVFPPEQASPIPIRYDLFGFANYTGLGIAVILLLLLSLSNNFSLVRLGPPRWKALQRFNYVAFLLLVLHGAAYQVIEKRERAFVFLFGVMVVSVLAFQLSGWRKIRLDRSVIARASLIPEK